MTLYIDFYIIKVYTVSCLKIEKEMAPHSSTLAWKIPWAEEPGGLQSVGLRRVRHDWVTSLSLFTLCIGEGNGNPLQCSCLENPRDRGAWWAAVYGVAQSRTRLKWLSSSMPQKRRKWQPTPVLLPGKSHGQRSLVGCSPWGAKSLTRLSDFTFTFHFHALKKEMATHLSVLAWRIPGTGEPGGLPSMGSHRVGHDWSDLAAAACLKMHISDLKKDFITFKR